MFKGVLHRMAANPVIYDAIQRIAGSRTIYRRLMQAVKEYEKASIVLDIGGGTGNYRNIWKAAQLYISLDNDMQKAVGFRNKYPLNAVSLLADARQIPLKKNSVDLIQCVGMSHHLQDDLFTALIEESFRVLKDDGCFVFLDACWLPGSKMSRFLWSIDRGSNPRDKEKILSMLGERFEIINKMEMRIYHTYLLCSGKKRGTFQ